MKSTTKETTMHLAREEDRPTRRILVTWGTTRGGTSGIARKIGEVLARDGFDVVVERASDVRDVGGYDAAIIGGALHMNRWHRDAHRFVARNVAALRRIPVWFFSSGPLDYSADQMDIPPTNQVAILMERVGARGHATFGGCLAADVTGFPAAAMAKNLSGDWRNPIWVCAWAAELSRDLPSARPGTAIEHPARSLWRLAAHGFVGWALCALVMTGLLRAVSTGLAVVVHAVLAALIFTALAVHYFHARGARAPLPTALAWGALVVSLDAIVVTATGLRGFTMLTGLVGTCLPFLLIVLATWTTGLLMSTLPWPKTALHGRQVTHG